MEDYWDAYMLRVQLYIKREFALEIFPSYNVDMFFELLEYNHLRKECI